jgi:hypothetical protein
MRNMAERRDVIVATDGREVHLLPVAQVLIQKTKEAARRELVNAGLPLEPPTYTVDTVAGTTETHVHDDTTLSTDEDKAAWAAYQAALVRLGRETNARATKLLMLKGIDVADPSPEWLADQAYFGIDVPDDPRERKLAYIETEVLKTPEDIIRATTRIMQLSLTGLPEEDLAAVEALFRGSLAGSRITLPKAETGGVEL